LALKHAGISLPVFSIPLTVNQKQNARIFLLAAGAILLSLLSQTTVNSISIFGLSLPTFCGFKLLTGFDCPGCGLTRAVGLALHGEFYRSYLLHLWGIPFALLLLAQIPYRLLLLIYDRASLFTVTPAVRHWTNQVIILSILIPWVLKTAAVLSVRIH
jgi:hypothetical protein